MIKFKIPYPPSTNQYYRMVGGKILISKNGRDYRTKVLVAIKQSRLSLNLKKNIKIMIEAFPPDDRKRDIDNLQKPVLDALEKARVFKNDSQIKILISIMSKKDCTNPHLNIYMNTLTDGENINIANKVREIIF